MIERKDRLKNKIEVTKVLTKDPSLTQREVAKKAWVSKTTVHNHMKEIEQNWPESDIMDKILRQDDEIMDLVNSLTVKHIKEKIAEWESLSSNEVKILWDLANNSTKRKAIFWNNNDWDKTYNFIIS